jgi:hypothetical protein
MENFYEMTGPFPLNKEVIDAYVNDTAGNYVLGFMAGKTMYIQYVGRSDTSLNERLKAHLGEGYTHFRFSHVSDTAAAYRKECQLYHHFHDDGKRLDNEIHPDKPTGAPRSLSCPVCGH